MDQSKYPIGRFSADRLQIPRKDRIKQLENFPTDIRELVLGLSGREMTFCYRKGSWNIQQLVHHCADSHMNGFIRFKLALTSDTPEILPYDQPKWAELHDSLSAPISLSLDLLHGLHGRWTILLKHMTQEEYSRNFIHPNRNIGKINLDHALALYSWHGQHHMEHIKIALKQKIC
jgi:hypothetical protein